MQPCWLAEKAIRSDAREVQKVMGEFLKLVATKSKTIVPSLQY
jgi:hypothetical protein